MDSKVISSYADEVLGLSLDSAEAEDLTLRLAGLRLMVAQIEGIRMPYLEDPFTSPRSADRWIEQWKTS